MRGPRPDSSGAARRPLAPDANRTRLQAPKSAGSRPQAPKPAAPEPAATRARPQAPKPVAARPRLQTPKARPQAAKPGTTRARPATSRGPVGPGRTRDKESAKTAPITSAKVQDAAPPRSQTLLVRSVVLAVTILLAVMAIGPTARAYLQQRAELEQLQAEVEAIQNQNADLEAELARWSDPNFVAAQARERLGYVRPGETPYRVVDPEVVSERAPEVDAELGPTGLVGSADDSVWYEVVWSSIELAGSVAPDGSALADQ